jgi:hypothetical protein
MIPRLLLGALIFVTVACAAPPKPLPPKPFEVACFEAMAMPVPSAFDVEAFPTLSNNKAAAIVARDRCLAAAVAEISACGQELSEASAYAYQHVAAREERMEVIRFASEASMNAYIERNEYFDSMGTDLDAIRNLLESRYGIPSDSHASEFTETSDEEAERRMAEANACAAPFVQ